MTNGAPDSVGAAPTNPWPPLPTPAVDDKGNRLATDPDLEYKKILYQAQVTEMAPAALADVRKARDAADVDRQTAAWANEYALRQSAQQSYLDVAKATIDRSQARAQFIQVAAGAIATVYNVALAWAPATNGAGAASTTASPAVTQVTVTAQLVLPGQTPVPVQLTLPGQVATTKASATSANASPTPPATAYPMAAIAPTFFLAVAILGAAVYLAYLTRRRDDLQPVAAGPSLMEQQHARVDDFINWVTATVTERLWALHAGVMALAIGVILLPLPYLLPALGIRDADGAAATFLIMLGGLVVLVIPLPWRDLGRRREAR